MKQILETILLGLVTLLMCACNDQEELIMCHLIFKHGQANRQKILGATMNIVFWETKNEY